MSFSNANQKAKQDFLADATISNTKKSPYYWSAFVYYGTIEAHKNNYFIWVLVGVFIVLLVWYLLKKFR